MIIEKLNTILAMSENNSYEYIISDYLLNHWKSIMNMKINDIAKEVNVSRSTLLRYIQGLGYKNINEVSYQLYQEKTSTKKINNIATINPDLENLYLLLKNKKRIIVIGNDNDLGIVLSYKQIFNDIGLKLCFKFNQSWTKVFDEYKINEDDIVFYISLTKNNMEVLIDYFDNYQGMVDWLEEKGIPIVYIGKMSSPTDNNEYIIEIKDTQILSDSIYQLCHVLEEIYSLFV